MRNGIILFLGALAMVCSAAAADESASNVTAMPVVAPRHQDAQEAPLFFPHNYVRGYLNFEVAAPHNEPDLGLCGPVPTNASPQGNACAGFARYVWSGYTEIQPFGRGLLRRFFVFVDPKAYFGSNIPQHSYTASHEMIGWERVYGAAVQLPKRVEIRLTHHDVQLVGKYGGSHRAVTGRADGPLGLYTTVGVRWYFGELGHVPGN